MAFYSLSARFNSVFFTASVFMAIACVLNQFTGYFFNSPSPTVNLQVAEVSRFYRNARGNWDEAHLKFKMEANLSSYYSWNLKQLFVYIEAEWVDQKSGKIQQNTLWDNIIEKTSANIEEFKKKADFKKKRPFRLEYPLRDVHSNLKGQEIKLNVWIEFMPVVGIIYREKIHTTNYTMPQDYVIKK